VASSPGVWADGLAVRLVQDHSGAPVASAASDNEVKVTLAADGGSINVKVNDKDGNPVPDIHVAIARADVRTGMDLAGSLIAGDTDQDGAYAYGVLAPGKYIVFATRHRIDPAVDAITKIWSARAKAKVVEVPPKGAAQVTLEPLEVE
jgi:hypothetical protein